MNKSTKLIARLSKNKSLLDLMIEVERFLSDFNIYAYKNWQDGMVYEGPFMSRYKISVTLLYPYNKMPEPDGARVLRDKLGVDVDYKKVKLKEPIEPDKTTEKLPSIEIKFEDKEYWLVKLTIPSRYVDDYRFEEYEEYDDQIDVEDLV